MAREERADRRRQIADAKIDRTGQLDGAARPRRARRRRGFSLVEVGEQLHAALVERLPALGERQASRGAMKQARVKMRLELRNVARAR